MCGTRCSYPLTRKRASRRVGTPGIEETRVKKRRHRSCFMLNLPVVYTPVQDQTGIEIRSSESARRREQAPIFGIHQNMFKSIVYTRRYWEYVDIDLD